jgi:hypothetical protein
MLPAGNIQSSAPEDGRDHRLKHVELIGIINKPLLLRLVGFLYYLQVHVLPKTSTQCQNTHTLQNKLK